MVWVFVIVMSILLVYLWIDDEYKKELKKASQDNKIPAEKRDSQQISKGKEDSIGKMNNEENVIELTYEDKQILSVMIKLAYSLLDAVEALELKGEGNYVTKNDIFALAEKLGVDF